MVRLPLVVRLLFVTGLVAALTTSAPDASPAQAAEPLAKADLQRYFDLVWSADSTERAAADEHLAALREQAGSDERLVYAQVLAKIKQRQYSEAVKLVDTLVASDKAHVDHWRTKIWLSVLLKQYSQASLAIEKLVARLPPVADPPEPSEVEREEIARFLGRVQGFFDGPVSETFPEAQRTALRKKIADQLGGERKVAFLEGRDAVLEQYLSITDEKEARREKSREEAERERDAKLTQIDETREQAAQRTKELDARKDKLRSELNDELNQLQKQDAPLARRFAQLDAQVTGLRRELALIDNDRARVETLLARERDPVLRATYIRELARLDALAARYETDITVGTRAAAGIAAQRADLDRRAALARGTFGQQAESTEREQADLNKRAKKAEIEEKRLRNKNPGESNSAVLAKAAQAAAFTTYEPYPLEEQRQALLDSLK